MARLHVVRVCCAPPLLIDFDHLVGVLVAITVTRSSRARGGLWRVVGARALCSELGTVLDDEFGVTSQEQGRAPAGHR